MKFELELISVKEVAIMCGVHEETVRRWKRTDRMPPPLNMSKGKKPRLRWNITEIELWLKCRPKQEGWYDYTDEQLKRTVESSTAIEGVKVKL